MSQEKTIKRKRTVTSCTQCYTKKQKVSLPTYLIRLCPPLVRPKNRKLIKGKWQCNHQYPCDHCTRRRRPELCSYAWQQNGPRIQNPQHDQRTTSSSPTLFNSDFEEAGTPAAEGPRSASPASAPCMLGTGIATLVSQNVIERPLLSQWRQFSRPVVSNFVSCFGYLEGGDFNLLSLMDKVMRQV